MMALETNPEPVERPAVGDLMVAAPMDANVDRASLVLVTSVEGDGSARVSLVTPRVAYATDADLLLPRSETGYHVDLIAQSEIIAPVWWCQLERKLGMVPAETAAAIGAASLAGLSSTSQGRRGMPIASRDDPRRAFKLGQLEELRQLASDCVRQIMAGNFAPDVDPNLVELALSGDLEALLAVSGAGMSTRAMPMEILGALIPLDFDVRSLGMEGARVFEQLFSASLAESERAALPASAAWEPQRTDPRPESPLNRLLAFRRERGETCVRLRTTADGWSVPETPVIAVARIDAFLVQVKCETEEFHGV